MAVSSTERFAMISRPESPHLDPQDIAAYVDGAAPPALRARVQAHMADCAACRNEVLDVLAISRPRTKGMPARVWRASAIAAAALIVVVAWPGSERNASTHREGPIAATIAPRTITPVGGTTDPVDLLWSKVPNADGYAVRVFDAAGNVVWNHQTPDTTARVPDSTLQRGQSYFWKVEARAGFGRSVASELVEFFVRDS